MYLLLILSRSTYYLFIQIEFLLVNIDSNVYHYGLATNFPIRHVLSMTSETKLEKFLTIFKRYYQKYWRIAL